MLNLYDRAYAPPAGAGRLHRVLPVAERKEWDALMCEAPFPHLTQTWAWGEAKRLTGWEPERLVVTSAGRPVALCQALVRRVLGIPVATRVNRGPVFLDEPVDGEEQLGVLRALRRHWGRGRRGVILFAPSLPASPESARLLRAAGFVRRSDRGWCSALIDLERPLEAIRAGLGANWRNKLNGALRSRLELRESDDLEWMLERHEENMREKGFTGPDAAFVRRLVAASAEPFMVLQAVLDGRPCGGTLILRFGQHAEYFLAWYGAEGRKARAGNFLVWHAIVASKGLGCRAFDLGGYGIADRYGRFKRDMRGREYRLAGEWLSL